MRRYVVLWTLWWLSQTATGFQRWSWSSSFASTPARRSQTLMRTFTTTARPPPNMIAGATTTTTEATTLSSSVQSTATTRRKTSSFEGFDYLAHWYPISWLRDLPVGKPTKITLFDTEYVATQLKDGTVHCLLDQCPHKKAALSEGRITGAGYFQCAYHGWSFDGKDGSCMEIPQVVDANRAMPTKISSRACAKALPVEVVNGMVWVFPGGIEAAMSSTPPPSLPEMDDPDFVSFVYVRDLPVDWSIVIENICDPDHGLFSHGALGFDLYTASRGSPQAIEEESMKDGKGWTITSRVNAVEKLLSINKNLTGKKTTNYDDDTDDHIKDVSQTALKATTTFVAPNFIYSARRDEHEQTKFITPFWLTPTGTGRCRFMSASVVKSKLKVPIPRAFGHVIINNFLDQDTYLLATQNRAVLEAEATMMKEQQQKNDDGPILVRKSTYVYQSPTERIASRLGDFFDETLSRAPRRLETLKQLDDTGALRSTPPRSTVLDRQAQHLDICPDSKAFVTKCESIRSTSRIVQIALLAARLLLPPTPTLFGRQVLPRLLSCLRRPSCLAPTFLFATILNIAASKLKSEFYYKYTEELRDKDLANIPNVWKDKERKPLEITTTHD